MPDHPRHIVHLDLDCFFVSVERNEDPALIGKPVAVGGSPGGRGVIASASYEARAFGVRSAMPTAQALRLCPQLIVVRSRHHQYGEISDRLFRRMCELAPVVEPASIDEMYLDLTGCEGLYHNDLPGLLRTLQRLILEEFRLPCSLALASTKTLAKIAVGTVKRNGLCVVPHGAEESFLAPLPIGVIPGVGKKTEQYLTARGFFRVADLQALPLDRMVDLLGAHGVWLHKVVHGKGTDELSTEWIRKSIGREETFGSDIGDVREMEKILFTLVEDVCATLRGKSWKTRTVGLKLRYADFKTITRAHTIEPTDDDPVVFRTVRTLLRASYSGKKPVRLLGVHLSNFDDLSQLELPLLPQEGRREQALKAVDEIRAKFGDDAIHLGRA
jgi:DNA polymerase-4